MISGERPEWAKPPKGGDAKRKYLNGFLPQDRLAATIFLLQPFFIRDDI